MAKSVLKERGLKKIRLGIEGKIFSLFSINYLWGKKSLKTGSHIEYSWNTLRKRQMITKCSCNSCKNNKNQLPVSEKINRIP